MDKSVPAVFTFNSLSVRSVTIADQPWVVAADVMAALEYSEAYNPAKATGHIPEEWKGVYRIHTPGGTQKVVMLSEHGLYFFLGRSDKPKALPFQKWFAGEVLPAIRKTGRYEPKQQTLFITQIQINGIKDMLDTVSCSTGEKLEALTSEFMSKFDITSYAELPKSRFMDVLSYIKEKLKPVSVRPVSRSRAVLLHLVDGQPHGKFQELSEDAMLVDPSNIDAVLNLVRTALNYNVRVQS